MGKNNMKLVLIVSSLIAIANCKPFHPEFLRLVPYPSERIATWIQVGPPPNSNTRLAPWLQQEQDSDQEERVSQNSGSNDYYCKDQYGNRITQIKRMEM